MSNELQNASAVVSVVQTST
jgi:hypothetical protein